MVVSGESTPNSLIVFRAKPGIDQWANTARKGALCLVLLCLGTGESISSGFVTNGAEQPKLSVHVARMVHPPVGSVPSGMILIQTDPAGVPELRGFISSDPAVGGYFGPKIFAGTPFENAPILGARISVEEGPGSVTSTIEVAGKKIVGVLSGLAALDKIDRAPSGMTPFRQESLEAAASQASLDVDGAHGTTGGPWAVVSPAGIYAR